MKEITISVRNKIPRVTSELKTLVADNTEYRLIFDFDEDWTEGQKQVILIVEGVEALAPVTTAEDAVTLPAIRITDGSHHALLVGVQQGDTVTTRPAVLTVYPSAKTELLSAIVDDERVTLTWLEWVNANMATAAENVRTAQEVLAEAQTAAETAEQSAESAAIDAAAARISAQTTAFPVFFVDENGHIIISRSERLGTTTFQLTSGGHLEVHV